QERRALEAAERRVRLLDPHVAVAERANRLAGGACAEDVGQREVGPPIAPFVVARGLERREERPAGVDVIAKLPAVLIPEIRGIRDQESAILAQRLRPQIVLVDEVEEEPSLEERVIEALQIVCGLRALGAAPILRSAAGSIER